ncbi:hypothetical protein [Gallaecimonas mangrovi]|uniref:hypothetical protein n=1 Tax=Gallaecimonas mangrovi TaxID=2291597 RepID=UPI000E2075E4|nr:hypothetical protein [Gallaecimonas mangrovi]
MRLGWVLYGALLLAGCASSSPYTYYVYPLPFAGDQARYHLDPVAVRLKLGSGAIKGDSTFANQAELQQEFTAALKRYLKQDNLLATAADTQAADIKIDIAYKRNYSFGGHSLVKPDVSHQVLIEKAGKKLADIHRSHYTTKYGAFKDAAVDFEIAAFSWDEKDEPKDVDLIAKNIVGQIAKASR